MSSPAAKEKTKEPEKKPEAEAPPQAEKPKRSLKDARVPLMLDFALTVAKVVVLLAGVLTAVISALAGAVVPAILLRGAAAMLSLGALVWIVNYWLARDTLEIARQEALQTLEKAREERPASTVEVSA
ncbi:MAG: hypothetical protein L0Z70_15315 [Chloroflexi bacterium]|nr:hypothetical protein [Chloroflexota bacterium]